MVNQASTPIAIYNEVLIQIWLPGTDSRVWRTGLLFAVCHPLPLLESFSHLSATFLLIFAQYRVVTLLVASHDTEHIMSTPSQIPFEQRAAMLWIDIEILLIALDDQFLPAVALEIAEFVTLPGHCTVEDAIGCIFSSNEVMVDSGAYMCHVDATKQTMPVGIV